MQVRNYGQNCSVARACDLLGERWTLLIVRDLLIAPRRFSELERRLKGMGTNLLAKRLKEMRIADLLCERRGEAHYSLSEMGLGLEPLILNMAKWSLDWLAQPPGAGNIHYPDWDLLALKALYRPDPRQKQPILARFASQDWVAWVAIDQGTYAYGLGEPEAVPDVHFSCLVSSLRYPDAIIESLPLTERTAAEAFVSSFAVRHRGNLLERNQILSDIKQTQRSQGSFSDLGG